MKKRHTYTLTLQCPDRSGLIAAVSNFIAQYNGSIIESSHHADPETQYFFMRDEILAESLPFEVDVFRENFSPLAKKLNLVEWEITDSAIKPKVIIMVSQQDHCLADLLQRWHSGEMDFQLCAVISNHDKFQSFVEWHNIPFHHAPLEDIKLLLAHYKPDTIVLARYMQILPPDICTDYAGRIINIHHSFLPSFSGARPYHQAHALGVKLIGATCHYVTPVLDAGPIIEQDLIRVAHSDSIDDMVRLGRDIEKMVLARGLHYHLHNRVLLNQQKTIVFR